MARILVVEDERVIAWYIQEVLEQLGHTVLTGVASGVQAIEIAEREQPEVVLMDIRLKGDMDGIVAAEQIYTRFDIPVIYLTAHTDLATLQRAKLTAPFGYLVKPLRAQELKTTIEITLHRHQLEQQAKSTQHWLATTLNSIGDGAIATDIIGTITFINPAAELLTGWQQVEAIGQPITQVFNLLQENTLEVLENPLLRAIQQGTSTKLVKPCLLRSRTGAYIPIGDSASPIRNQNGQIVGGILIFQDISDRPQFEMAVEQQQPLSPVLLEELAQPVLTMSEVWELLDRLKTDFINSVSHQLRTPLTNMRMAIEMLHRIVGVLKPAEMATDNPPETSQKPADQFLWQRMEQYLQVLQEEWQQEFNLINTLLNFRDAESLTEPLLLVAIDLHQWLPAIVDRFAPRAIRHNQHLTCQISPELLSSIQSHPPTLERIVTELLDNACKFTPPNQQIRVTAAIEAEQLKLTIANTGIEIPPDELVQIFQPFHPAAAQPPARDRGMGLGLALTKRLVVRLGGEIEAISSARTTAFIVRLPC
jgi:PAS domain S-box-containing protein